MDIAQATVKDDQLADGNQHPAEAFVTQVNQGHREQSAFLLDEHGNGVVEGFEVSHRDLVGIADQRNLGLAFACQDQRREQRSAGWPSYWP